MFGINQYIHWTLKVSTLSQGTDIGPVLLLCCLGSVWTTIFHKQTYKAYFVGTQIFSNFFYFFKQKSTSLQHVTTSCHIVGGYDHTLVGGHCIYRQKSAVRLGHSVTSYALIAVRSITVYSNNRQPQDRHK